MPYLGKETELEDREAWYAYLRDNPPTKHPHWIEYLVGCSIRSHKSSVTHFGEWLYRRHRNAALKLHAQWLKRRIKTA